MLSAVVVATDFSAAGDAACERALQLRFARRARLRLVHVPALAAASAPDKAANASAHLAERVADARRTLKAAHADLHIEGCIAGDGFDGLLRIATEERADLLVLGRPQRRSARRLLRGCALEHVIRAARVPVLVACDPSVRFRRILVVADPCESTKEALDLVLSLRVTQATAIDVVHIAEAPLVDALRKSGASEEEVAAYVDECRHAAMDAMSELLEPYRGRGVTWRLGLRTGNAMRTVVDEIHARDEDLVVLGSHARTGIARTLLAAASVPSLDAPRFDILIAHAPPSTMRPHVEAP